jgi:hypothetical protein
MMDTVTLARRVRVARILVRAYPEPMTRTDVARLMHLFVDGVKPTIDAMVADGEIEPMERSKSTRFLITDAGREVAKLDAPDEQVSRGYDHRALWDAWQMTNWIPSVKEIRT